MGLLISLTLGIVMGYGAAKLHPRVNGGMIVNLAAGAIGGLLGAVILGPLFTPMLQDVPAAGAALGASVGGGALAVGVGYLLNRVRGR